tara:strand:+ start:4884 stop:5381 length:498 start_codon:yes stop_codon:yes gene_type:complete
LKITKSQLKQFIKEELESVMRSYPNAPEDAEEDAATAAALARRADPDGTTLGFEPERWNTHPGSAHSNWLERGQLRRPGDLATDPGGSRFPSLAEPGLDRNIEDYGAMAAAHLDQMALDANIASSDAITPELIKKFARANNMSWEDAKTALMRQLMGLEEAMKKP